LASHISLKHGKNQKLLSSRCGSFTAASSLGVGTAAVGCPWTLSSPGWLLCDGMKQLELRSAKLLLFNELPHRFNHRNKLFVLLFPVGSEK